MFKFLVDLKDHSRVLSALCFLLRQPKYIFRQVRFQRQSRRRKKGYIDPRYAWLKAQHNTHVGERCFIVATGPSITLSDLHLLRDECTFSMNSAVRLYDKTDWRPTYYGIQDWRVYDKLQDDISRTYNNSDCVLISQIIARKYGESTKNYHQFPLNTCYHDNYLELNKYFAAFSDDCYDVVYDGYSITYSLIQIAVYMGFKEIYLLGVDCSYKHGEKNHIVEAGNYDKNAEKNYDKMVVGYRQAKQYADAHGIKIVNCTRGGALEVFERQTLESVLHLDEQDE